MAIRAGSLTIGPRRLRPAIGLLLLGLTCMGCVGPHALQNTRLRYNEVYRATNDEQLLLNIVRLRYADSPVFIDLPTITGQYEAGAVGGFNTPLNSLDPGIPNFAIGQLMLRDTPTLSYHPREGKEIASSLIEPLNADLIRFVSPGSNTLLFLLMTANDINDIRNAPLATSLHPRTPDDNAEFRILVDLLVRLQERGAIEIELGNFAGEQFDSLPVQQVSGQDVLQAAQNGFAFRIEGERATLEKRQKTVAIRIRPADLDAPDVQQLVAMLRLRPGQNTYNWRDEQLGDDSEREVVTLPNPLGGETIKIHMRSVLQVMSFLSKGVCVPEEHVLNGIAPMTPGIDRAFHDWSDVTAGLMRIRSQKHRPRETEVAIHYRGYWFYIDSSDTISRSTLALLELLLEIQETDRKTQSPLLTLPL